MAILPEPLKHGSGVPGRLRAVLDLLDFEKRNQAVKGIEWMPWCQQAMKDVISCDKLR